MALEDYMLSCPTKKYLGIDCLGCGTQRALALILEGKFLEAFQMFPAIYSMLFFGFFILMNFIDKKRDYSKVIILFAVITAVTMIVSFFIKHH
ncbi:MAG: DUF2752 domain-containing protein [Cruoricaptor ignavus]|nr:DUF2752 domain-containing protein [Cruoricaptor ignavus]